MIKTFLTPQTVQEAVALKKENPDALYMTGGAWINSSRSDLTPETVISLSGLGLKEIKQKDKEISFEACVTLQEIIDNPLTPEAIKESLVLMRNRNLCNQGTLVGTVATKQPCFSVITVLLAFGAVVEMSDGEISLEDYLNQANTSLILAIRVNQNVKVQAKKHSITARSVPLVSVACGLNEQNELTLVLAQDGGKIVVLTSLAKGIDLTGTLDRDELAKHITQNVDSFDDYRTSAAFKKHLAGVFLADCILDVVKGA